MKQVRGYEKLDASERCRLSIAAMARDDHTEFDRLYRTCPRKQYSAIVDLKNVACCMTLAFSVDIAESIGKAQILAVLAAQHGDWHETVRDYAVHKVVDQMALFDHFARTHIGVTAEVLLRAYCRPILDKFRAVTQGCGDYRGEVDPVLADEIIALCREAALPSTNSPLIANPAAGEA